ncbi:hypothetical protein [Nostoc sp. DSM 114167]|jgi:hypothetical protein|uniref:hypothetical protein n=1 Tax=Nostoc sp. DSM 114167 TaxID=3439050 RepID=UPI004046174F
MHNKRLSKTPSSINTNSQAAEQNPRLAYRPFGSQIQKASVAPVTETDIEDVAFAEQKFEATSLELQAKYGKITPEGQERLTVLQAKMDGLLNSRLEHATRFEHNIANISLRRPDIPIQAKLTIGEPGDKYEQEADETARQVVQKIHQPQREKLQRDSLPEEEDELQMKPEGNIQCESLPEEEEEELQMKPMVQRVSDGGVAATQDLETSINQARGEDEVMKKDPTITVTDIIQRMPAARTTRTSTRLGTYDRNAPSTDTQGRTRGAQRNREQRNTIAGGGEVAPPQRNLSNQPFSTASDQTKLWNGFERPSWSRGFEDNFWASQESRQETTPNGEQRTVYKCQVGSNDYAWLPRSGAAHSDEDHATIGHIVQWRNFIRDNIDPQDYEVLGGVIEAYSMNDVEQAYQNLENLRAEGMIWNSKTSGKAYGGDPLLQKWK